MTILFWLVVAVSAATLVGLVWYILRKAGERRLAEEARVASFLAASAGKARFVEASSAAAASPADPGPISLVPAGAISASADGLRQQKLLFDSAHKASEAGEPALAIQLYARLLARYPASAFVPQARAAAEALKKRQLKD